MSDQLTVEEQLEKIWAECFPPTTQELIIQALRDIAAVVDGLQSRLGALGDEMEKLKEDCRYVEVEGLKTLPRDTSYQKFFNASEIEEYGCTSENLIGKDAGVE